MMPEDRSGHGSGWTGFTEISHLPGNRCDLRQYGGELWTI
jgi:hypothetical protein